MPNKVYSQVVWTPYGTGADAILPVSYFRGVIRFCDVTEAYMPDRVTRQFGYQQRIPRQPCLTPALCILSKGQKGYQKDYGNQDHVWESWVDYGMEEFRPVPRWGPPLASTSSPVTADYMEWFLARSHVRISNPIHDPHVDIPPPPPPRDDVPPRPGVAEVRAMILPLLTDARLPEDVTATLRRAHEILGGDI